MEDEGGESRCRICLDTGRDEPLLNPCYCSGSMGLLHRRCLEEWLTVAQSGKCEICNYQFKVYLTSPRIREWLSSSGPEAVEQRCHMISDCLCLLVMVPLIAASGFLCYHLYSMEEIQIDVNSKNAVGWEVITLFSVLIALTTVFSIWLGLVVRYYVRCWLGWRKNNMRVRVSISSTMDDRKREALRNISERLKNSCNDVPAASNENNQPKPSSILLTTANLDLVIAEANENINSSAIRTANIVANDVRYSHNFRRGSRWLSRLVEPVSSGSSTSMKDITHESAELMPINNLCDGPFTPCSLSPPPSRAINVRRSVNLNLTREAQSRSFA